MTHPFPMSPRRWAFQAILDGVRDLLRDEKGVEITSKAVQLGRDNYDLAVEVYIPKESLKRLKAIILQSSVSRSAAEQGFAIEITSSKPNPEDFYGPGSSPSSYTIPRIVKALRSLGLLT